MTQVARAWAVVNNGIILVQKATSAEAIAAAVRTASNCAVQGRHASVVVEEAGEEPRLIWDSARGAIIKS